MLSLRATRTCQAMLLTCLSSLILPPAKGQHLPLPNASFEQGTGNKVAAWGFWNWARQGQTPSHRGEWDRTVARSGKAALKIQGSESGQVGCWDNKREDALIPIVAGDIYELAVWVRLQRNGLDGQVDRVSLGFYGQDREPLPDSQAVRARTLREDCDWTRLTVRAKAPEAAAFARIDLAFTGAGSAWFDDVSLRALSAAEASGLPDLSRPFLRAAQAQDAPQVDGLFDEAAWQAAIWAGPLVPAARRGTPEETTTFALTADASTLFVAVRCREALLEPALQRTHEVRAQAEAADGPVLEDDCVELYLQPEVFAGTSSYLHLAVNPRGTLYDARVVNDTVDVSWSSGARCATHADDAYWSVELAIPFAALGGAPAPGSRWGLALQRQRTAAREITVWAAPARETGKPAFGDLAFAAPAVSLAAQRPAEFEAGPQAWHFTLKSSDPLTALILNRRGQLPWNATARPLEPQDESRTLRLPYMLNMQNTCIEMKAPPEQAHRTLSLRTDRLPIQGGQAYRFAARVKADALTGGARPLAFSISSYDANDTAMQSYAGVLNVPEGTYDWTDVSARWVAPENAASILFWVVKWGNSGVTGTLYMDDIQLCPEGEAQNVLPNGAVETDEEGAAWGWNLFSGAAAAPSYEAPNAAETVFQLSDTQGRLLYRSPAYRGEITPRITEISASFALLAGSRESDNVHRIRELYVNEGGVLSLPLVLRSSYPERYAWADLVLDVPDFIHLLSPEPRADILSRTAAEGRRTYRIRFGPNALTPIESSRHNTVVTLLVAECGKLPDTAETYEVRVHAEVEGAAQEPWTMPLQVLPPLQWLRPQVALIKHWACSSYYRPFRQLNDQERDAIAATWRQAGFNRTGAALDAELRQRYGFSARGHIPLITAPGSLFPGGAEYLDEHPEARALTFAGQTRTTTFCPTYFLSEENRHLDEVREWLAHEARRYPHMDWDYEVPVTRETSICACERCLQAFRQATGLSGDALTRTTVLQAAKREWIDWRCRENARIAHFFREVIKQANPDCLFSIYSGYQGSTDEKYGVDWRYMALPADLIWAGYGRPVEAIRATHEAIAGRPFICGELAWFGVHPWSNANAQVALLRRLSDGGSGIMAYFNWIVDGRFYHAVSRCAAVTTDHERFFRWDIAADGTYRSRYQRADDLVQVGGEGTEADVTVLRHADERLLFVFNETPDAREFTLQHRQWQDGMAVVDVESRKVWRDAEHALTMPPREARILCLRPPGDVSVEAPRLLAGAEAGAPVRDPLVAWQGQGSAPGSQVYDLQIGSGATVNPNAATTYTDLARTALLPGGLDAGKTYWWRVRGRDAVSGTAGPWSETGQITRGMFSEPAAATPAFSPNDDGILDVFTLTAELVADLPWSVAISDATGTVVHRANGQGNRVTLTWDGRIDGQTPAAAGHYTYSITPADTPGLAISGSVELNPKVGLRNPAFDICRGFVLSVPSGRTRLEKDYAVSLSQTHAIRLDSDAQTPSSAYWSNYAGGGLGNSIIPVEPGKTYRFAAAIRTDLSAGAGRLALAFFTAEGRWAQVPGQRPSGVDSADVSGRSEWTECEVVLTAPENAFSAVLFFRVADATGSCWFDQPSFGEAPAAP